MPAFLGVRGNSTLHSTQLKSPSPLPHCAKERKDIASSVFAWGYNFETFILREILCVSAARSQLESESLPGSPGSVA